MTEAALHRQIRALLNAKGIVFIESAMHKRSTNQPGLPDFCFAIHNRTIGATVAYGWECKIGDGKLSPAQEAMFERLRRKPNAWHCVVIRSLDDAIYDLT